MKKKWIYLDNHATTPLHPEALQKMLPFFGSQLHEPLNEKHDEEHDEEKQEAKHEEHDDKLDQPNHSESGKLPSALFIMPLFGNPASASHPFGWHAADAVHLARKVLLKILNVPQSHLLFTSGASESIQLALFGFARAKLSKTNAGAVKNSINRRLKFVTTPIEHKVVLSAFKLFEQQGHTVEYVDVDENGKIIFSDLEAKLIGCDLCSIIHGNNEIGTLQDLHEISQLCKKYDVILHVDAAQSFTKVSIDLNETPIHFFSFSSHKFYGPKGMGGLVISPEGMKNILPLYETAEDFPSAMSLRIGTANVPGIVGMAEAAKLAFAAMNEDSKKFAVFKDQIFSRLSKHHIAFKLNGHPTERLPQNLNLSFPELTASGISSKLSGIAYSTGSACSSESPHLSHVLKAIGLSEELIRTAIRIGFGHFTTEDDIRGLLEKLDEFAAL